MKFVKKSAAAVKHAGGDDLVGMPADWDGYPGEVARVGAQTAREHLAVEPDEGAPGTCLDRHPRVLTKAAKKKDTYEPLNRRWTPYSGYVAWQAITKCLATPALPALSAPPLPPLGSRRTNEFTGEQGSSTSSPLATTRVGPAASRRRDDPARLDRQRARWTTGRSGRPVQYAPRFVITELFLSEYPPKGWADSEKGNGQGRMSKRT